MNILCINGSADVASSNQRLINSLPQLIKEHTFINCEGLMDFPVFTSSRAKNPPTEVIAFKSEIEKAEMIVISSPEYIHNLPAVLKNALEWITASGEMNEKKVLVITYTPAAPRGEYAMASIVESLKALNAKVVAKFPLYQTDFKVDEEGNVTGDESIEALKAVFEFAV